MYILLLKIVIIVGLSSKYFSINNYPNRKIPAKTTLDRELFR